MSMFIGRLLIAAALAAALPLACSSSSGHLHEQGLLDTHSCDTEVVGEHVSLIQYSLETQRVVATSSRILNQSEKPRLGLVARLVCDIRLAAESVSARTGHAWPAVVVIALVALVPGAFLVSVILAMMYCSGPQDGSPKNDSAKGKDPRSAEATREWRASPRGAEASYLRPTAAAAVIASWNTTSTVINFPFAFGVLGTLGGIGCTMLLQGAACLVTLHMVDLTTHFNDGRRRGEERVTDFPGLGKCLGGKLWGDVFAFTQMLNQLAFLPYALTLMVSTTQALFPHVEFLQCNIHTCLIAVVFGYTLVQLSRDWKHAEGLSYLVLFLMTIMAIVLICFAFANDRHYGGATPLFVGTDYQLFSGCIGACIPAEKQYSLLSIVDAIGYISWSFAPSLVIVELMSEMEHPETDAKVALAGAFTYGALLHCVVGLVFSILWGNQIPAAVQSLLPKETWQSIFINLVIFVAMVLDLFICLIVVNRYIMARFHPSFDYKWTAQNAWDWACVTLVPATVMFLMTLFTPHLASVLGFINCFCLPQTQYMFPIMFTVCPALRTWLSQPKSGTWPNQDMALPCCEDIATSTNSIKNAIFIATCVFAYVWSGLEFYQFVHGLADLDFGAGYLCNEVASLA